MDLPYYHGPLSKQDCEKLLLREGVDGHFLLRDSESMPGVLCLCVSFKKFVYTYRIFKEKNGYYNIQTAEGAKKQNFSSLKELISQYEKPKQGLVVQLLKPIKRASPCLGWRRSKLELEETYENQANDYENSSTLHSNTVYGKSGSIYANHSSENVYSADDYVDVLP